jgi:sensor histidine kinase YesM
MQKNGSKLFNQKVLLIFVGVIFIIQLLSIFGLSARFSWSGQVFPMVLSKSLNSAALFFVWILCLPLMPYIKNKIPYSNKSKISIIKHFLISILIAIILDPIAEIPKAIVLYFYDYHFFLDNSAKYLANIDIYMLNFNLVSVAIYWAVLIYLTSMENYQKYQKEALRRAEAESLISKAELTALKMQIQPHFLFNTLHSVTSLIDEDREEAQDVIAQLGDLLRYTLDQKDDFILLSKEIEFIQSYLSIEKIRFKDRLQVSYNLEAKTELALVPCFILQALIENSVKHALSKNAAVCKISIAAMFEENNLKISVQDNGNGSSTIKKGIGLENTENRLKNYYSNNYSFVYGNIKPSGFNVEMTIPISFDETST